MNQRTRAASGRLTATALLADLGIDPAPYAGPARRVRGWSTKLVVHEGGGGRVLDGPRNNSLMSMAGLLRRLGGDYQSIKPALHAVNLALFQPPLPDDEVDRVAQSACRYVQGNPGQTDLRLHDEGNARRFVDFFGHEIRYVAEMKKWLIWNGRYWQLDVENAVLERAKKSADLIAAEAMAVSDDDVKEAIFRHARASHQEPRLRAMVKLAESDPAVVIRIAALDRDPFLLPVENGVLDLRTGKLREHRPEDLITRIAPVAFDPTGKVPDVVAIPESGDTNPSSGAVPMRPRIDRVFAATTGVLPDRRCERPGALLPVWLRGERQEHLPERREGVAGPGLRQAGRLRDAHVQEARPRDKQ